MVAVTNALQAQLLRDADLCVKCGLCLPHCPTYRQTLNEGESPRGRIALLQSWTQKNIALTPQLEAHIDGCLACGACEPVCPAHVPYGRLLDHGRELLAQARPGRVRALRLLAPLLTTAGLRTPVIALLWLYQRAGLSWLIRRFHLLGRGSLARLESLLPPLPLPRRAHHTESVTADVGLFTGCTGAALEPEVLRAAQTLLERCGYRVAIPPGQVCCGAVHQHAGLGEPARALRRRNAAAFAVCEVITGVASGCTAELARTPELGRERVRDIHELLLARIERLNFRPLRARVAVHTPCTLSHGLHAHQAVNTLLRKIPELELVELDPTQTCCGAAGSYLLTQPQMADALLQAKISAARLLDPDFILSSNIGCSLHLAAGVRRAGLRVPVRHPLAILARQAVAAP